MSDVEVLKFGSSVLRSPADLHIAVDEIYRRRREGSRVLAVVSAFEGVTDELMEEFTRSVGNDCPAALAAYVSVGEQQTAAMLLGRLQMAGVPSRLIEPHTIGLVAQGSFLESTPLRADLSKLQAAWDDRAVLVLPGYYGVDWSGDTMLFGRGGSDLSALFLAGQLGVGCRLLKDVPGVFDGDPASHRLAHRFAALSWSTAIKVAGPLIQPKGLHYAQEQGVTFEVGRPNEQTCTRVGHLTDEWAHAAPRLRRLGVALVGCGTVGRGVYETVRRYPNFDLRHVLVRDTDRYADIERVTAAPAVILDPRVDAVVICASDGDLIYPLIMAALKAGKFVVTANKAAVAAHGAKLNVHARVPERRLWYSAAVGGALPALETIASVDRPIREIRGIVNGTCGAVLDAWASGRTRLEAIAAAQAAGFAETDPNRDLSGRDSADKLVLMVAEAFGVWLVPEEVPTSGIESIGDDPDGFKLVARAARTQNGIQASVAPERPPAGSFLGQARGIENRLEIELETGEVIRLRGKGAGRWPTTVSIMGDLHEIARGLEPRSWADGDYRALDAELS